MYNTCVNRRNIINRKKAKKRNAICVLILIITCGIIALSACNREPVDDKKHLSKEVLEYKPVVEKYATEYGISDYTDYLLAIMQVESGGREEDVMQSSESLGLEPNTLTKEDSIKQGCKYFSELVKLAKEKQCDIKSVIQSYNYGKGFLDYVNNSGKEYSFTLAKDFAEKYSQEVKVSYNNPIAIKANGGWRYRYGNMFYVDLVNEYVDF